jgi:hypothetical protein
MLSHTYARFAAQFGLAVGLVVFAGAECAGTESGGAFNPAIGLLPLIHGQSSDVWVYVLGPLVGR